MFSCDRQDASQCADLHKHTQRSVLTAHLWPLSVLCSVASESCKACHCECHTAIVSSVQVESYCKHGQACDFHVCPLHMWGSVMSNNAESCHSGRGSDCDNIFKEQLKHAYQCILLHNRFTMQKTFFLHPGLSDMGSPWEKESKL